MKLCVMTGDFMTGKTTWIEKMLIAAGLPLASANPAVREWQQGRGTRDSESVLSIAGVYTPAVFEGAAKTGIDATLLPDCQRFAFATKREGFQEEGKSDIAQLAPALRKADESGSALQAAEASRKPEGNGGTFRSGWPSKKLGWNFDDGALTRINRHFATIDCRRCDLLVIDELGPMELLRGGGFTEGMALLDEAAISAALLVVRPSLLDAARERWGAFEAIGPDASIKEFLECVKACSCV